MDEPRVEFGVRENSKKKLMRSMLKWAGHVKRMRNEQLDKHPKRDIICLHALVGCQQRPLGSSRDVLSHRFYGCLSSSGGSCSRENVESEGEIH